MYSTSCVGLHDIKTFCKWNLISLGYLPPIVIWCVVAFLFVFRFWVQNCFQSRLFLCSHGQSKCRSWSHPDITMSFKADRQYKTVHRDTDFILSQRNLQDVISLRRKHSAKNQLDLSYYFSQLSTFKFIPCSEKCDVCGRDFVLLIWGLSVCWSESEQWEDMSGLPMRNTKRGDPQF